MGSPSGRPEVAHRRASSGRYEPHREYGVIFEIGCDELVCRLPTSRKFTFGGEYNLFGIMQKEKALFVRAGSVLRTDTHQLHRAHASDINAGETAKYNLLPLQERNDRGRSAPASSSARVSRSTRPMSWEGIRRLDRRAFDGVRIGHEERHDRRGAHVLDAGRLLEAEQEVGRAVRKAFRPLNRVNAPTRGQLERAIAAERKPPKLIEGCIAPTIFLTTTWR